MTEKEVFYSILEREIDNLLCINPSLAFFSRPIKNWVLEYIDPYVSLFMEGDKLRTDMATSYIKEEVSNKINNFKKKFEEEIKNEQNE